MFASTDLIIKFGNNNPAFHILIFFSYFIIFIAIQAVMISVHLSLLFNPAKFPRKKNIEIVTVMSLTEQ